MPPRVHPTGGGDDVPPVVQSDGHGGGGGIQSEQEHANSLRLPGAPGGRSPSSGQLTADKLLRSPQIRTNHSRGNRWHPAAQAS
ncbi:hypothetical protein TUSST3_44150 [Streptomyces sp. TUS-ST3]|nr:hypothetical protein TUSST3_44150 [Streptomyces sp. TUS-ST3]